MYNLNSPFPNSNQENSNYLIAKITNNPSKRRRNPSNQNDNEEESREEESLNDFQTNFYPVKNSSLHSRVLNVDYSSSDNEEKVESETTKNDSQRNASDVFNTTPVENFSSNNRMFDHEIETHNAMREPTEYNEENRFQDEDEITMVERIRSELIHEFHSMERENQQTNNSPKKFEEDQDNREKSFLKNITSETVSRNRRLELLMKEVGRLSMEVLESNEREDLARNCYYRLYSTTLNAMDEIKSRLEDQSTGSNFECHSFPFYKSMNNNNSDSQKKPIKETEKLEQNVKNSCDQMQKDTDYFSNELKTTMEQMQNKERKTEELKQKVKEVEQRFSGLRAVAKKQQEAIKKLVNTIKEYQSDQNDQKQNEDELRYQLDQYKKENKVVNQELGRLKENMQLFKSAMKETSDMVPASDAKIIFDSESSSQQQQQHQQKDQEQDHDHDQHYDVDEEDLVTSIRKIRNTLRERELQLQQMRSYVTTMTQSRDTYREENRRLHEQLRNLRYEKNGWEKESSEHERVKEELALYKHRLGEYTSSPHNRKLSESNLKHATNQSSSPTDKFNLASSLPESHHAPTFLSTFKTMTPPSRPPPRLDDNISSNSKTNY